MINNIKIYDFNRKLKKTNTKSRSDTKVFTLIKQSINGEIIGYDLDEYLAETLIDSKMLSKEEEEIEKKLKRIRADKNYELLMENFKSFQRMSKKYNDILPVVELKGSESPLKKDLDILEMKLLYLIIELRASLGMDLSDISNRNVEKYIDAIVFDIMNEKYEPASILKHIDDENVELSLTKVKK